jgi:hypothetical protein
MLDNYKKDKNGVIFQIEKKEFNYGLEYVETRYTAYDTTSLMSYLRLGALLGKLAPYEPMKLLDVGYGNGDFLKTASSVIPECFGADILPAYPLPENIKFVEDIYCEEYDIVCFFDSLEHFDDIYDIKSLKTKYVFISVPWCHYISDAWFDSWKHRREDEHLWHFDLESLTKFFESLGYEYISHSSIEDIIRKPVDDMSNILTALFRKI